MVDVSHVQRYQAGNVAGETTLHAVRPTVNGYRAWCGAGSIVWFARDRYDENDDGACQRCASLFRADVPGQRPAG